MSRRLHRLSILLLALMLTVGAILPVLAEGETSGGTEKEIAVLQSLGKVTIPPNSYFELKQVNLFPDQGGKTVTFNIDVHNGGSSDLLLLDYWVRLQTVSGATFTVRAVEEKSRVAPGATEELKYYAVLNDSTNMEDLVFQFIKWDFSQPNYQRVLGQLRVPADYSNVIPVDMQRIMSESGTQLSTYIDRVVLGTDRDDKFHEPTIHFNIRNIGNRSVDQLNYKYWIQTAEGLIYPLTVKDDNKQLHPRVEKELELSGQIPIAIATDGWSLIITQQQGNVNIPVAIYALPAATEEVKKERVGLGQTVEFKTSDGAYAVTLTHMQRLPWENEDILTAELVIRNVDTHSLPIPELDTHFLLDEKIKRPASIVSNDRVIGIMPGNEISIYITHKVPYTYEFSSLQLVLEDKADGEEIAIYDNSNASFRLDTLEHGEYLRITDLGRRTNLKVNTVNVYPGDTASIYSVQIEMENKEQRLNQIPKFYAYFETEEGVIFKAQIADVDKMIIPGGKVLATVSAIIPNIFDTSNLQVRIGEAITDQIYLNAVALKLPEENKEVSGELKNIQVTPYTVSLNRVGTYLYGNEFTLTFDYELTKDLIYEMKPDLHKLVVELVDKKSNIEMSKSISLENEDGLKLGKHKYEFKQPFSYADFYVPVDSDHYVLNIYDEFTHDGQTQKKLLASKELRWYIYNF